ncbi:MAG: bifunctional hydroxymethylpyrimidine kinase/phosphomethylpyrimidine kinase [Prevotellaceae bacterium]|nr:bifunctional hydroxymethylpyrimidine kinase/phosphomethylpyrimidine kinase [Prevotella sp.]MDD7605842.1 bifunctional hydroxymethylpyrimidine kinase/phosphomethylpyrimidine kinase [Prevotellaceae bacterium]
MSTILTITGSDSTGGSGVQADIRAITELGGRVVSVITSLTIQNTLGIQEFFDIPASTVANQIEAIANDTQPDIVKIGMVRRLDTLSVIVNFLQRYKPAYVLYDPVVFSSNGDLLMESHLIGMIRRQLLPLCSLIVMRRKESRQILGTSAFDTVYLLDDTAVHGLANQTSTTIAYYLATGHTMAEARQKATEYIKIKAPQEGQTHSRSAELYRDFLKAIAAYIRQRSDVAFYADYLNVTSRYLGQVTNRVCGLTPKALIEQKLIEALEHELQATDQTIQEIANGYKFSSQAHFTKLFKRITGDTPSNYRKNHIK